MRPFFRDHFARLDRQIVLIDVLAALNGGQAAVADLERAMTEILECFRTGSNSLWSSLFAPRIDRIVLAATKADHLHQQSHDRLEAILARLAGRAMARAEFAGAEVNVLAMAAIRATREGEAKRNGETLPCIIGYPLAGETIGRRTFDGNEEFAIFPGDLPADPRAALQGWQTEAGRDALRAVQAAQSDAAPFRRLRAVPKYPPRPRHRDADRRLFGMSKKAHRKPAAFRVEEVEVFVPPALPAVGGAGIAAGARAGARMPDLGRGLSWGSILIGALGGLVSLLASLWLYDYVLALIARDDWIGWAAAGLLGARPVRAADDHPPRSRRARAARASRQDQARGRQRRAPERQAARHRRRRSPEASLCRAQGSRLGTRASRRA